MEGTCLRGQLGLEGLRLFLLRVQLSVRQRLLRAGLAVRHHLRNVRLHAQLHLSAQQ